MVLKEQELHQIDEQFLRRLQKQDSDALVGLSIKLTSDLKEALAVVIHNQRVAVAVPKLPIVKGSE